MAGMLASKPAELAFDGFVGNESPLFSATGCSWKGLDVSRSRMARERCKFNLSILSASNHEATSDPLIPSREFVQKMTELIFPEIVEIQTESRPEIRGFLVRKLEQRLLSEQAARLAHNQRT